MLIYSKRKISCNCTGSSGTLIPKNGGDTLAVLDLPHDRLLSALGTFNNRARVGTFKLVHLKGFNRLDVISAENLTGENRGTAGEFRELCDELTQFFQHLRGGTRSIAQIEAINKMSESEIHQKFLLKTVGVSEDSA